MWPIIGSKMNIHMCVGLTNNLYIWFMEKINLKGYIIAKSREGEKNTIHVYNAMFCR